MRLLILPALLAMLSLSACAQHAALDKFYAKFHGSSNNGLSISMDNNFMLNACFSGKEGSAKSDSDGWFKKVTQIRLLILDEKNAPSAKEWSALSSSLRDDHYEDLVSIRQGGDRVQLMSADVSGGLKDVVFIACGTEGGGMLVNFKGRFTEKDLEKMQDELNKKSSEKE